MQQRFQLGRWLCGLGLCAALVLPGVSAQNRSDRPPARQQPPPRQQQAPPPRPANPAPRNDRSSGSYHPQGSPQGRTQESPRPQGSDRSNRLAENQKKFNQLPPQKQQEMKRAAENWQRLTPQQQSHIRNDVLPRWQQLPTDRQRAIQNRLGVLQNMPESARNRHLNDPNFTRGMSEDDRQMLRDLSHEHVGAPDRPQEQ